MADVTKVIIKRLNDNFLMEAVNESANKLLMDATPEIGGENKGFRPMQLLLSAMGGCSAIDILHILKKQGQEAQSFEIEVTGEKEKKSTYSIWKKINLHFILKGNIDEEKALKAAQLSMEKYCSVSKMLEPMAEIAYTVSVLKL